MDNPKPVTVVEKIGHAIGMMLSTEYVKQMATNDLLDACYAASNEKKVDACLQNKYLDMSVTGKNTGTVGYQMTPLMLACYLNNDGLLVSKILNHQNGVDVNQINECGDTALTLACRKGYFRNVELLITHDKLDVNLCHKGGISPLQLACSSGSLATVSSLLSHPNIIVEVNNNVHYPTILCCMTNSLNKHDHSDLYKHQYVYLKLFEMVICHPQTNVNAVNERGNSALHVLASKNNSAAAEVLINTCFKHNKQLDTNLENVVGQTPLELAIENSNNDMVAFLLTLSDVKVDSEKCLRLAIRKGSADVFKSLLQSEHNVKINKQVSESCFKELRNWSGRHDTITQLFAPRDDVDVNVGNTMFNALSTGTHNFKLLLSNPNVDVNRITNVSELFKEPGITVATKQYGPVMSLLSYACVTSKNYHDENNDYIDMLLSHPNIDVNALNSQALFVACTLNLASTMLVLLGAGANITPEIRCLNTSCIVNYLSLMSK